METMAANGGAREAAAGGGIRRPDVHQSKQQQQQAAAGCYCYFQMPLHYPRYSREEYEGMPEWQLDRLLSEYGLPVAGTLHHKRAFAIGAFLWAAAGSGNSH